MHYVITYNTIIEIIILSLFRIKESYEYGNIILVLPDRSYIHLIPKGSNMTINPFVDRYKEISVDTLFSYINSIEDLDYQVMISGIHTSGVVDPYYYYSDDSIAMTLTFNKSGISNILKNI